MLNSNPVIEPQLVNCAKDLVAQAKNVLIFPHKGPDGDAVGSGLALYNMLLNMGKEVHMICPDAPAKSLLFLPGADQLVYFNQNPKQVIQLIHEADLICYVDFNSISRLGDALVAEIQNFKGKTMMFDHHPSPQLKCDVAMSDCSQPSTCQLLFQFMIEAGWLNDITPAVGDCLYTGMMTDTGFLSYNASSPVIYTLVAQLLKLGIHKELVHDNIQNDYTETRMRLISYALSEKMVVLEEYNTAYISLTKEELHKFNYEKGDLEGVVNIPLRMPHVKFVAMFTEDENIIKVSLRSKKKFPANRFSQEYFEGGGHLNAAGGKSDASMDETIARFVNALPQFKELLHAD